MNRIRSQIANLAGNIIMIIRPTLGIQIPHSCSLTETM